MRHISTTELLDSILETSDFPRATRKVITLAQYESLKACIDTSPVEYQRPYDSSREAFTEKGLAKYILDLFFFRESDANMLPAIVIRQLHPNQIQARIKSGRKNWKVLELTDGQHRTMIMFKILSGEIRLPENYVVPFKGRTVNIGGKTIPELKMMGADYRELIETHVMSMDIHLDYYHNISDAQAAQIFAERNSGTPQSRQGVRNCQTHKLCVHVRSLARDIPDFDTECHPLMSVTRNKKGELVGNFYPGKMGSDLNFDEDVARTLATIIGYDKLTSKETMSLDQNTLDSMYAEHGDCLNERYYTMLTDVLDFQHDWLSRITPKLRQDRVDKSFWNAMRYISVMLVARAHKQNKILALCQDKTDGAWLLWRKVNALVTSLCEVPKKDRKKIKQTLFERSLSKMNWYSKTTGTGLSVVFEEFEKFLKQMPANSLGVVFKDRRQTFSAKTRAIAYTQQNGRDAITGLPLDYEDAEGDHIVPRARGGVTEEDNLQVVSNHVNNLKGAN